jgi:hypothetical protein
MSFILSWISNDIFFKFKMNVGQIEITMFILIAVDAFVL